MEPKSFQENQLLGRHGYSTLAYIPEDKGSWALPLCHERITSFETPITRAAFQLKFPNLVLKVILMFIESKIKNN